jgi:flagellar hook-associated protein 2
MAGITAAGLGSGLDINNIVKQLVQAERTPFDQALVREDKRITPRLSALGAIKAAAAAIKDAANPLKLATTYQRKIASSSNVAAVKVAASSVAAPASYQMKIDQIATTQTLATAGFASIGDVVGTGDIVLRFGTTDYSGGSYQGFTPNVARDPVTVTIDSDNNTLTGVMSAINAKKAGVRASIVNDGSGFRLLLTTEATGANNSLEVTVTGDADGNNANLSGLSRLAFNATADNLEQTLAAKDAQFNINGISINSASNIVSSAIPGLTLTLQEPTSTAFNLNVQPDTAVAVNAAKAFVAAYNGFRAKVTELTGYDRETKISGPLISDFTTRSVVKDIEGILRGNLSRLSAEFSNLAEFGFTTNKSGTLQLDEQRFTDTLVQQPDKMARLYQNFTEASDPLVTVRSTSALTQPGTYAVNITALATQGSYTGSNELPDFDDGDDVTINSSSDQIRLRVDGIDTGNIDLIQGDYTSGQSLATMLQDRINASSPLINAGISVEVLYNSATNSLKIQGLGSYGSSSRVDVLSAKPQVGPRLGLDVGTGSAGSDVAGTINGVAATGEGQRLTAANGNPAQGIVLRVDGGSTGSRGNVTFDLGIWPALDRYLGAALGNDGVVTKRINGFETSKRELTERSLKLENRWKQAELNYRTQYSMLDRLVAQLRSTSSALEGQLASITAAR